MINDIMTMVWKEWKGLFRHRGSQTRFLLTMLSPILLAIVMPLQAGEDWVVEVLPSLIISFAIPIILVGITIPESFAGERERHTLGTLLASRLPDRAILLGKLGTSVAFAWGVNLLVLLLALVTVNVAHWDGRLLLYTPTVALGAVALSFIMSTLCASAGVLVSMRSETVQEAAQRLMAIFLVPPLLLQFALLAFMDRMGDTISRIGGKDVLVIVLAVMVVVDVAVFLLAISRFKRSRLVLL